MHCGENIITWFQKHFLEPLIVWVFVGCGFFTAVKEENHLQALQVVFYARKLRSGLYCDGKKEGLCLIYVVTRGWSGLVGVVRVQQHVVNCNLVSTWVVPAVVELFWFYQE